MSSRAAGFQMGLRLAVAILVVATLASCRWNFGKAMRTGEKNPQHPAVSLNSDNFSCLKDLGKSFTDYFAGKLSERRIRDMMKCSREAIAKFAYHIRPQNRGDASYTPFQLRKFLNDDYLRKHPIPETLMNEVMKMKVVLLGGTEDRISRSELSEMSRLLNFFEEQAVVNLPYIRIYRLSPILDPDLVTKQELIKAREQVQSSLSLFAEILQSRNKKYSVTALENLAREIHAYIGEDEKVDKSVSGPDMRQKTTQALQLFRVAKELVTGIDQDVILPKEWGALASAASISYGVFLNYELRMKDRSFMYGPPLDSFIGSVREVLDFLNGVAKNSPHEVISFQVIDKLLEHLHGFGWLPANIRLTSLTPVYKHLFSVGFRNPKIATRVAITGIGVYELGELRGEFTLWADGQKYLSDNAKRVLNLSFSSTDEMFGPLMKSIASIDFSNFVGNNVDATDARGSEIFKLVDKVRPLYRDGDERTWIAPLDDLPKLGVQNSLHGLTRVNIMRGLVRLLIRSFGSVGKAQLAGVTEAEMVEFYNLAKPLGEDFKLMDPRKGAQTAARYFSDANMFTFSGDGFSDNSPATSLMNQYESIELLAVLWSSNQVTGKFFDSLQERCRKDGYKDGPLDVFQRSRISRECFYKHFRDQNFAEYANLPRFMDVIKNMGEAQYAELMASLEAISLIPGEDPKWFEHTELGTITGTFHYIEVLFSLYDANKDDRLSSFEAMRAFRRFAGFIQREAKKMGKDLKVSEQKGTFAYLVKNRRLPQGIMDKIEIFGMLDCFNESLDQFKDPLESESRKKDGGKKQYEELPEFEIDRLGALQILRLLAESSGIRPAPP